MKGMRESSVVGRLKRFYEENPDEELTFPDICAKFSCSYNTAAEAVKQLRHIGFLENVSVIRTRKKGMGL